MKIYMHIMESQGWVSQREERHTHIDRQIETERVEEGGGGGSKQGNFLP